MATLAWRVAGPGVLRVLGAGSVASVRALGRAGPGRHLVVVKVPIDGEAVSPGPLGLIRCAAPGPPLDHTGCVALGAHQLWGFLALLQGPCSGKGCRGQAQVEQVTGHCGAVFARCVWPQVCLTLSVWRRVPAGKVTPRQER